MTRHDGHAFAYSNGFSAVYFFSFLNPLGAIIFCVSLFKSFDYSTTIIGSLFTNTHQKFNLRRMDKFYECTT